MAPSPAPARRPNAAELAVDVGGGASRLSRDDRVERRQRVLTLAIAETPDAEGVLVHRFAHDLTLRLVEPRGRLPQPGDRVVVQREGHFDHTDAILPY